MLFKIINKKVDIEFENNLTWALPSGRNLLKKNNYQLSQNLTRIDILKYAFILELLTNAKSYRILLYLYLSFSIFKLKLNEHLLN